jgi:(p)ppGpp synthase/HD superfamily hydrolase
MIDSIISPRYIAHSLERGFNLLRMNFAREIKTKEPAVITLKNDPLQDIRIFSITKHGNQKRKGGQLYFVHVLEVEEFTEEIIFELKLEISTQDLFDLRAAAILHDTIEDTYTDYEDIQGISNAKVAELVSRLSNDKRLSRMEREDEFIEQIRRSSFEVHIVKLADLYSNLIGIRGNEGEEWIAKFAIKCSRYLDILDPRLHMTTHFIECSKLVRKYS